MWFGFQDCGFDSSSMSKHFGSRASSVCQTRNERVLYFPCAVNSQLRTRADKGALLFKFVLLNETCSCGVPLPVKLVEWKEFISVKLGAETWSLFLWKSGSRKLWVFLSVKLRVVVFELVLMNAMCCCGVLFHGGSLDFPC